MKKPEIGTEVEALREDGTRLKGEVIEYSPDGFIVIKRRDGRHNFILLEDVKRAAKT